MAKRLCSLFLILLMILSLAGGLTIRAASEIYYDGVWHTYTGNTFQLKVNGKTLSCSVPPIVFNDYSVVPARDVFEELGANVSWYAPNEQITVNLGETEIILNINKKAAYRNKKVEPMPIAPKLINGKTMIPVRYVAESLGFDVSFDSKTDTITITDPNKSNTENKGNAGNTGNTSNNDNTSNNGNTSNTGNTGKPENNGTEEDTAPVTPSITLNSYKRTEKNGVFTLKLQVSKKATDVSHFTLKEPNRIVIDLGDVKLGKGVANGTYDSELVTAVRYGQHDQVLRVVLDVPELKEYSVTKSSKAVTIKVKNSPKITQDIDTKEDSADTKENDSGSANDNSKGEESDAEEEEEIILPDPADYGIEPSRSITIDAGHGGSDPGAVFTDEDGEIWRETDINLAVALKIRDILEKKGVRVVMTRTKEETVVRRTRPELANEEKTALFISIHTNSVAGSNKANGIETWGSLEKSIPLGGVGDKQFAENVQKAVIKKTSATDRGLKDSVDLTVLLYSAMPSVLVEVGFISNEEERENMFSEKYRNKLAEGIAEGILKTFEDMGV